ncbi:hypothetical protein ACPOL_3463 [Acidisarcina polymorpha]|uniref:Uncharacterized protein n=1 Tax=Acidisarcina polymorpha TaxID=2211140 RepID=A0A2Z5G0T8_9BACT|nr:hypothetical protein [Acidisarcina polymorpha]AXC12748.1 hypothetical protein ACPOL_3463 [Acidisarcina polymorpha]
MSKDVMQSPKGCEFPAIQLRKYRKTLAQLASALPSAQVAPIMTAILSIENLRLHHETIDGCGCWYAKAGA